MSVQPPRLILEGLYAFPPNRATSGGTAYLCQGQDQAGQQANLLIDAPANEPELLDFLRDRGGVHYWVITHRGASGEAKVLQSVLNCSQVLVQEQEAYLLPDLPNLVAYRDRYSLPGWGEVFWTPGFSPGSACVYLPQQGGILFTGRHLLPNRTGQLQPLRLAKTFHWPRQLRQVSQLKDRFTPETLAYACPAANMGFLRGQAVVKDAYQQLQAIDPTQLLAAPARL
ncbi:MAG: MBL fold metallo-hydrolase [Cyanobacteria bacterium P01_C01_bin.147]